MSRNATGTTTRAGESKVANRRSGARRMYATPAAAPQPAANASERPGCQPVGDPEHKRSDGGVRYANSSTLRD